jgi:hypothetical protein
VRRQLFAAGVSVALLIGAGAPALATPGKGKPHGPKARVNGGGITAGGASFSVEARAGQKSGGHFNYTSKTLKVRCKDLTFNTITYVAPGTPGAHIEGTCVEKVKNGRSPITVTADFFDHGATGDVANITFTRPGTPPTEVKDEGPIKSGNIRVRY